MAGFLRGDIVWANLDPTQGNEQTGKRPVLIVSHDIFNARSGTVIAMALTSQPQKAGFPLTMPLDIFKPQKSAWVKISQIRTLSTLRLGKKVGRLNPEQLAQVIDGLFEIVG